MPVEAAGSLRIREEDELPVYDGWATCARCCDQGQDRSIVAHKGYIEGARELQERADQDQRQLQNADGIAVSFGNLWCRIPTFILSDLELGKCPTTWRDGGDPDAGGAATGDRVGAA
jgi:hypothetical protein